MIPYNKSFEAAAQIIQILIMYKVIFTTVCKKKPNCACTEKREQKAAHPRAMLSFKIAEFANSMITRLYVNIAQDCESFKAIKRQYTVIQGKSYTT